MVPHGGSYLWPVLDAGLWGVFVILFNLMLALLMAFCAGYDFRTKAWGWVSVEILFAIVNAIAAIGRAAA